MSFINTLNYETFAGSKLQMVLNEPPRFFGRVTLSVERTLPLPSPPSAPSKKVACFAIITEALISRSCLVLHFPQVHLRTDIGSVSTIKLHTEHVFDEGKKRPIWTTDPPFHSCLYFICLTSSPHPASPILRERRLFFIILATAKSSKAIIA